MLEILKKLGLPELATQHGEHLDIMNAWVHLLMAILFVGWGAFFIYVLIRFRAKRNPRADYEGTKSHLSALVEVGVALVEIMLIVGFAIPLWAERVNEFPSQQGALIVHMVAEQFAWNVHYSGKDGKFGKTDPKLMDAQTNPLGLDKSDPNALDDVTTINQLHLPANRPVIIQLTSKDVIHGFGVPEFRVKQDVIPGLQVPVWFIPTVTTKEMRERMKDDNFNYEIACAQLCGIGHYRMKGYVTVHTAPEFDEWLSSQQPLLGSGANPEETFWQ